MIQYDVDRCSRASTSESCSSRSLPEYPIASAFSMQETATTDPDSAQARISNITPPISSAQTAVVAPESVPLFDFLRTVFLPQLIRPTAQRTLIDFFSHESLAMALRAPFFMHALLACSGAEILVEGTHIQAHFQRLADSHYAKAVAGLRANLDTNQMESNGTTILRTVIMLCIFEACQMPSSAIRSLTGSIEV